VLHARGLIQVGEPFVHESILGSRFESAVTGTTTVVDRPAVITTIAGQAWITGIFQYGYDPTDPFREGFTLPDTWIM
jgi:proline racemase